MGINKRMLVVLFLKIDAQHRFAAAKLLLSLQLPASFIALRLLSDACWGMSASFARRSLLQISELRLPPPRDRLPQRSQYPFRTGCHFGFVLLQGDFVDGTWHALPHAL